jgi:hypothetical protein
MARLVLLLWVLLWVSAAAEPAKKKLVVLIVVDQLRFDHLSLYRDRLTSGGFRRLAEDGIEHLRAFHDHFPAHTACGHTALATGALPSVHGVVGNRWLRTDQKQLMDAGLDHRYEVVGGKPGSGGFSPHDILAPTLGDTLKWASRGQSKVVTVAMKDRAAVLLSGPAADASFWLDEETGNWVSSRFFAPDGALPPFVVAWNQEHHPDADFGRYWNPRLSPESVPRSRELSGIADYKGLGPSFPHRIDGGREQGPGPDFYVAWTHTPWGLDSNVQLALQSLDFYDLGRDDAPDLLNVGIATMDKVGHVFGPDSAESLEMLLEVDRALADLLDGLESRVGLDNCLVVLTSDHGVMPLAERLQEFRAVSARLPLLELRARLAAALAPRWSEDDFRLEIADPHIFVTPASGKEADKPAMLAVLAAELETVEGVLEVLDGERLALGQHRGTSWESTITRSHFPGRSGDLILVCRPNSLLGFTRPGGTNHGSPWTYDNHVPLLMHGWPRKGHQESRTCAPRQVVPTICLALGLTPPGGCDAEPLPWALEP